MDTHTGPGNNDYYYCVGPVSRSLAPDSDAGRTGGYFIPFMTRPMQVPGCKLTAIYVPIYRTCLTENLDRKRLGSHVIIELIKRKFCNQKVAFLNF